MAVASNDFRRIIVIQTAFLGDVILITPLIRATKCLFPDAEIDVLVIPETESILANNPHVRRILTFDKRRNKISSVRSVEPESTTTISSTQLKPRRQRSILRSSFLVTMAAEIFLFITACSAQYQGFA